MGQANRLEGIARTLFQLIGAINAIEDRVTGQGGDDLLKRKELPRGCRFKDALGLMPGQSLFVNLQMYRRSHDSSTRCLGIEAKENPPSLPRISRLNQSEVKARLLQ